jgi:hypothetical protein
VDPGTGRLHVPTTASPGLSAYLDACDREDAILSTQNVRAWVDEFATSFNFLDSDFVLRGVGAGGELCAAVNGAGDGAYGKWLNTTTDPEYIIPC